MSDSDMRVRDRKVPDTASLIRATLAKTFLGLNGVQEQAPPIGSSSDLGDQLSERARHARLNEALT
jgi:hypothetical protein